MDLILGPDQAKDIDRYLAQLGGDSFVVASHFLDRAETPFHRVGDFISDSSVKAFVTIMKGCDHVCSYCIVPSVRGHEVSRDPDDIVREINLLAQRGTKEVMLLGQNVNSYGKGLAPHLSFADLVRRLQAATNMSRLRFTSPHPTNLSSALVECYRHAQSLCPHIHLPVQSGSTSMLKKMRRSYTRDVYLRKIAELKMARPDVGVTTDIIVGFPGETEEDFAETMSLLDEVRYDGVYAFAYSPRPGTEAAQWPDDVPHEVKEERLQILLARQKEISYQKNLDRVGQLEAVLVEGPSRQGGGQLTGRTPHNRIVNFYGDSKNIGAIMKIKITQAQAYSLTGEVPR